MDVITDSAETLLHCSQGHYNRMLFLLYVSNRYTSVCLAGKFPSFHTPARAKLAVALGYLLALIISLPLCVLKEVKVVPWTGDPRNKPVNWCDYKFFERVAVTSHPLWTAYVWVGESLVRFLPAIILATLNWLIMTKFRGVVKTRLQMQQHNDVAASAGRAERHLEQVLSKLLNL